MRPMFQVMTYEMFNSKYNNFRLNNIKKINKLFDFHFIIIASHFR